MTILSQAETIRDEVLPRANTATRVGTCLVDIANSLGNVAIKTISATTYTVLESDSAYVLRFTNAGAVILTINTGIAVAGFNFIVLQAAAGQVAFNGTAALNNYDGHTQTAGQYATVGFICDTTGAFVFSGKTA